MIRAGWPAAFSVVAVTLFAACGDREPTESPADRAQREAAYRQACASTALSRSALDDLATVESVLPNTTPGDPLAELSQQAALAAYDFARAYQRHAEMRALTYVYVDSAINHSRTDADSVRMMERSAQFAITLPAEGTIEANVILRYQNNLTAILDNPDHPCNWDFPF